MREDHQEILERESEVLMDDIAEVIIKSKLPIFAAAAVLGSILSTIILASKDDSKTILSILTSFSGSFFSAQKALIRQQAKQARDNADIDFDDW